MIWNAHEFADMLLNHPSHWKIMEMVKLFPGDIAAHVLEKHELEMKHSYEKGLLNDQIRYLNKTIADLTEKNQKLSNDAGNLSKRVRELKAENAKAEAHIKELDDKIIDLEVDKECSRYY